MAGFFGSRSQQPNRLGSLQVPTSEYNVTVPYGAGTFKASLKLLDYTDFSAQKVTQGGKGGGNFNYEYYAAVDAFLSVGSADGAGNIFGSGGASELVQATETYTISGSGSYGVAYGGNQFYYDQGVTVPSNFSFNANDYGSDGLTTYNGTAIVPLQKIPYGQTPASGQYTVRRLTPGQGTYQFFPGDAGKTVSITYQYTTADTTQSTNLAPIEQYNLGFILGGRPGTPWGYMQTNHPERALSYPGLNRLVSSSLDLGSDATLPQLSVELLNNRGLSFGGGIGDCDPAAVIRDILTDPVDGCNWPYLGDLTLLSNFCVANNLFISPYYDSVSKATSIIGDLCTILNAEAVWSGAALKVIPYGDTSVFNHGRTFTPPTTPVYELDASDMVADAGTEPVKSSWPDLSDNFNRVSMEYTRRDNSYNNDSIFAQDEASIAMIGVLPQRTISAHQFCETSYAAVAMDMLLKRNAVALRQHEFTLKWWYFLLEPMDIVLIAPGLIDATPTAVRIVSIQEQEDYTLKVVAEDFKWGVGAGILYPKGSAGGSSRNGTTPPGDTQLLAAFVPSQRVTSGVNQLWLALTGGQYWGGCRVWMSIDGTTYEQIGTQFGSARAGSLTAPLAAGADPDTTDSAMVAVTGSLDTVSQAIADALGTLCLVGRELIAYETATLNSSSGNVENYALSYLRRGAFSSGSQSHNVGEIFVRLDSQIFQYTFDPSLSGRTVLLKFTSRNLYGAQEQDLASVTAYPFTFGGSLQSTTMVVSSMADPANPGTAIVQAYARGASATTGGFATLANGATIPVPAQSFAGKALSTFYALNFNPATSAYVLYTDVNAWLAGQAAGLVEIGSTTTPAVPATGGGSGGTGGGGQYTFTSFSDLGAARTANGAGAYTSGQNASVQALAYSTGAMAPPGQPSRPGHVVSSDGLCTWQGVAGTTASAMTLSVDLALTGDTTGSGTFYSTVTFTLDGTNYSTLFSENGDIASATYTAPIPANTDLSNLQVVASSFCSVSATDAESCSSSLTVANLKIS